MKNYLLLAMLLTSAVFAQWTSVKETNINVSSASSVDIFTNRDGNHIIVQESNNLKYYKMNLNGTAGSPITIENSAVVSPSISGDAVNIDASNLPSGVYIYSLRVNDFVSNQKMLLLK